MFSAAKAFLRGNMTNEKMCSFCDTKTKDYVRLCWQSSNMMALRQEKPTEGIGCLQGPSVNLPHSPPPATAPQQFVQEHLFFQSFDCFR